MRGSETTRSIFPANAYGASAQHSKPEQRVRPTLDALVEAACADIRNRTRLGRPLPIRGMR